MGPTDWRIFSGFEEEYERARGRRRRGDEPEIWLIFKTVDPARLKDPGPQLNRVLEFRKAQSTLGEVLFKDVRDIDDWKAKLNAWLLDHVLKLHAAESRPAQEPASAPERDSVDASTGRPIGAPIEPSEVPKQLISIASSLTRVVRSGNLEFSRQEADVLQEFDVARLFLLSATWMFRRYTADAFGAHEMNLLYKHRERLDLTPTENFQLLRTVVSDASAVVPGWYWFRDATSGPIDEWLLSLLIHDSSVEVRRRVLEVLRGAGIRLPKEVWPAFPLLDDNGSLRSEAYEYLAFVGDEDALSSLQEIASSEDAPISSEAREARLSILIRTRPAEAFSEVLEGEQYVSDEILQKLRSSVSDFSDGLLLKGCESQSEPLRKLSAGELAERHRFPRDLAEKLAEDPSVAIRQIAFTELASQGPPLDLKRVRKSLSAEQGAAGGMNALGALSGLLGATESEGDADAVILKFYRGQSAEAVLKAVEWFGLDGALAYKSLAVDHYDAVRGVLRADLEGGFARVRQQSIEAIESRFGTAFANEHVEAFSRLDDFVRSLFVEAALSGLAVNGEPSDIRFGRQYLRSSHQSVQLAAVRIICRFGTADDARELLEISKGAWGDLRDEAGACALRITSQPFDVSRELIQIHSERLVRAGYEWLYGQESPEVKSFFEELSSDGDSTKRVRSVYYFFRKLKDEELAQLLKAQFDKETYYYNVVTWLDRLLYVPGPLKEFFVQELERQAT